MKLLGISIGGAPVCSRPQDSRYISVLCTSLFFFLDIFRVKACGRLHVTIYVLNCTVLNCTGLDWTVLQCGGGGAAGADCARGH